MTKLKDLTGQRFGRLLVIKESGRNKQGKAMWFCRCDCGNHKVVYSYSLISGATLSCGCLHNEGLSERSSTHNKSKTRLYRTWSNIKQRCYNPNFTHYKYYGGRGLKMCDEWQSFEAFCDWAIANGYSENLTIERIDNDGDYEPNNCEWKTMKDQANNKSNNRKITFAGTTKTVAQWSNKTGIPYNILIRRLFRGWSIKEALTQECSS